MSARTMVSSICFGDDTTPAPRPSSRVNRPGGTGGDSSVFSNDAEPQRFTSRVIQPGGTGGKSSVFEDEPTQPAPRSNRPVEPSPLIDTGDAGPTRVHTRVAQPGGTGGRSRVFDEDPPESPTALTGERAPAPFYREDQDGPQESVPITTRVLQPGGTGGKSKVFADDEEDQLVRATNRINVNEPSGKSLEDDEERRLAARRDTAKQRAGGGPSKVFSGEAEEGDSARTFAGRKVEPGRTNKSQVALGGGYPDAEPSKRTGRRGNIRSDYNSSQISFGDDTEGKPVPAKDPTRTSSKVLRPGGTGGGSQITFGDDTNGETAAERPASGTRTSSRVLKPGGTGGTSQITF